MMRANARSRPGTTLQMADFWNMMSVFGSEEHKVVAAEIKEDLAEVAKNMAELNAKEVELSSKSGGLVIAEKELADKVVAFEAAKAGFEYGKVEIVKALNDEKVGLEGMRASLSNLSNQLSSKENALNKSASVLESDKVAFEVYKDSTQVSLDAKQTRLDGLVKEYEDKLAKLRDLVSE